MYRHALKKISEGLGPFARFLLGVFSALFAVMIIVMAADSGNSFWGLVIGIFCLAIAITCVTWGRVRKFAGSLLGAALFCMSLGYLWTELTGSRLLSLPGEPSVLNAGLFLLFLGIPGLAYALKARFGFGRKENLQ
jgi:hypothetical protein